MIVLNCLKAQGGIIAPVYMQEAVPFDTVTDKDVSLKVKDYGIDVVLKDLVIPIPEFMLDYFVENGTITLYLADDAVYLWEPIITVEIPKNSLVEANGIYRFMQKKREAEGVAD